MLALTISYTVSKSRLLPQTPASTHFNGLRDAKYLIEIYLRDGNSLDNINRMGISYDSPELEDVYKKGLLAITILTKINHSSSRSYQLLNASSKWRR